MFFLSSVSLNAVHTSYGRNVGKHFPLWVCAYTALASVSHFFIQASMKEDFQKRLGARGCLLSFAAGCVLGGATLISASLPAWGKGQEGFLETFRVNSGLRWGRQEVPSFVGSYLDRVLYLTEAAFNSKRIHKSLQGRLGFLVHAMALPILSFLDLTIGFVSLSLTVITLGKHAGCKRVAKSSWLGVMFGVLLESQFILKAVLPKKSVNWSTVNPEYWAG